MSIITIIAVAISSIVVLITLGKITHQLDHIISLFKTIDKKLSDTQIKEDISASQIQRQVHDLDTKLKTIKGDINWKD
ncbi:MAG: hypothetical protein V1709_03740 [Planctomycetota bacterium]